MKNSIKYLRRSAEFDMTQEELAKKIGVSRTTIVAIENGSSTSIEIALKLAKVFKKNVHEIFFDDYVASNLQKQNTA
jgi:putative transcriptional regulator